MKVKFPLLLIILSIFFISCSNDISEPQEGSISVDVKRLAALITKNNFKEDGEPDHDLPEDQGLIDEKALYESISQTLTVRLSVDGDFTASAEEEYTLNYADMENYDSAEPPEIKAMQTPITIKAIPVGSVVVVKAEVVTAMKIDEAKLREFYAAQGIPSEFIDEIIKGYDTSEFPMAYGESDPVKIISGENSVSIPLKYSGMDEGKERDKEGEKHEEEKYDGEGGEGHEKEYEQHEKGPEGEGYEEEKKHEEEFVNYGPEYIDENPVLSANGQAEVEKGTAVVTYRSKEKSVHPEGDGWAAGYWEFSNLIDYNKAYITLRAKTPDGGTPTPYGYRFCIKGYSPYYANESGQDRHSVANQYFNLEDSSESITIAVNIQNLCIFNDPDFGYVHFAPTALEFENCSYEGNWDVSGDTNVIWGNDWSLEIEKIRLVQVPLMPEIVIFDPDNEETINNITIQNGTTPTAPTIDTVTRRERTYLKVTPNGYNLGITLPQEIDLTDYIYVKALVYSENDSEEEQIGLALRLITPENENLTDQHRRISDDFFTETCSNKIVTMTGNLINGTQKVNHLTAFVLNRASREPQTDKAIYIGKIIATTSMASDFDLYQTAETEITISIEPVEESSDFEVNFSDITTDAGTIGKKLTAPAGFESYKWVLNGQLLPDATSNIVDIPYDLLNIGHNRISLFVTREGEAFSWNATIDKAYD